MKFQEQLQQYIQACGCSGKELADASGLSASLISRYRNGERVPRQDQPQLLQLLQHRNLWYIRNAAFVGFYRCNAPCHVSFLI